MMAKTVYFLSIFVLLCFASCVKETATDTVVPPVYVEQDTVIRAVDISNYPEIKTTNPVFYTSDSVSTDFLTILKAKGVNTIRLRLWVNPSNAHSGFAEVKQFADELKNKGFKLWLSVHYSDTWADPGHQQLPSAWQTASYAALKDSVYAYTKKVVTHLKPDYIQIGNEINGGFLFPQGNLMGTNQANFKELLQKGIAAVRENAPKTKIILHFAGIDNANWFFGNLTGVDYDIIGLSYYPVWHGKSLANLKSTMATLSATYQKDIVIAETAYPFTLGWNDWTNNIVGLESQLILPDFPASPTGQKNYLHSLVTLTKEIPNGKGIGFCYWGAELIAWKGAQGQNASVWENQALFNFQNRALPVLDGFKAR